MPLPEAIRNAPELTPGLTLFYAGFLDLTSCRAFGGSGMGPISTLAVLEYCDRLEIDGDQRDDFIWLIKRLDSKYLEWAAEKQRKETETKRPMRKPPRRRK